MGSVDSISKSLNENINLESYRSINSPERQTYIKEQQPEKINETETRIKEKELNKVVNDLNKVLGNTHTSLKYVYHEKLQKYFVSLIDDETKETVREIPPKKLLDMYASMKDYLGLFVDSKI